ncbi:hypothetical protein DKP76_03250 [Falsochrobactrum shanghaiense]|uniref:Uncharacterized protein n=1 Tax=Falsochrobactrum shanghaiense TaxID=2201899 RepID=A0A316JCJ3_9HYPH|nr:hypothetical protein DKP76_03250 [Falsochrobactrum shanghaiense]
MNKNLSQITPFIIQNHIDNGHINISDIGNTIQFTCDPWEHIRTTQHATLFINSNAVASMQLISYKDRLASPPIFSLATANHFQSGQGYEIYIEVVEPDGSDNPNKSRSQSLFISIS